VILVHKKLCQEKMGPFGKKLKVLLLPFCSKKPKHSFGKNLKMRFFLKDSFCLFFFFSIDKGSIF
jgi:hypothetical protein